MAKVSPATAYCAVGPDGLIDIDLVRRSQASAQAAAKAVHGLAWPAAVGKGWRCIPVRIAPVNALEEPEPAQPTARKQAEAPSPPPRGPERMTAAEYRRLVGFDAGVPMLRCGERRR